MKRVLLTGAGGAIGVHVIAHFMHNTDWQIVALDSWKNDHKGRYDRIHQVCQDHPDWPARITIFTHDLGAPFSDREVEAIGQIDYVINLASRSDVQNSIDDPMPFVRNNTELMLNILDYAVRAKPAVFLHFSTDEVYGSIPADSPGHAEWSPILPSNPYSASKAAQEALAIAWWRSYKVPLILTNTMNNFGEMQAPSKFPAMIQTYIDQGKSIKVHAAKSGEIGSRHYLHSRNSADALLFILRNVEPVVHQDGEMDRPVRLNIVGDRQVSNLDLVKTIGALMGKTPKYHMAYFHEDNPGHDLHYGLDGQKLADLGWVSPVSFEDSLKNTIDWQQRNKDWMQ